MTKTKDKRKSEKSEEVTAHLIELAMMPLDQVYLTLNSRVTGLSTDEARQRQEQFGMNEVAQEKSVSYWMRLFNNVKNPLVLLLIVLAVLSYATGDLRASLIILCMIALGVILRMVQELKADNAAAELKALVSNKATVMRDGATEEVMMKLIVPGDVVLLSAGDMIPADVRIVNAKDLFVNQASLTGEAQPVEKRLTAIPDPAKSPLDYETLCFMGSNVVSGTGEALVLHTGCQTYFGSLAESVIEQQPLSAFEKGVNRFTWMMIRFMGIMVPVVFLLNGLSTRNWMDAFLFAMAVAVGMTPEMLPMIMSVNLSKGAIVMSRKKVIVKRLDAIQNFGAMEILCTDKTGTITEGKIVLERHLSVDGMPNKKVLHYGYLNSYYHTGLKNLTDEAILQHGDSEDMRLSYAKYRKIDEIPFDFVRKRMTVIVEDMTGLNTLICKGAVEEVMACCDRVEIDDQIVLMQQSQRDAAKHIVTDLSSKGFRVLALAYKEMPQGPDEPVYQISDESELVLLGFLSFLDPPKKTAPEALERLRKLHVEVKILTGDNEYVTKFICQKVGMNVENVLLGMQIEAMSDQELTEKAKNANIFAKLAPNQKERIIRALQSADHVVGFMGDGINDAPALKAADVGISVDSAVDVAKESSDIILLDNNLMILEQGVIEGRRVFGNIIKYIRMAASSNFGNMFSVIGASIFLPFVPMLPIQVLVNNLLYDFSQTTIPMDQVDAEWLVKPREWDISRLERYILLIGPISSIFDYLTFFILIRFFNGLNDPILFHTGWFIESLFTQTLIIHVIRTNRIPFIESIASRPLIVSSLLIVVTGALLTITPLSSLLGFRPLPLAFWGLLPILLAGYVVLTQVVKSLYVKKYEE